MHQQQRGNDGEADAAPSAAASLKRFATLYSRSSVVGMFFGTIVGLSVPVSPIFRRTFERNIYNTRVIANFAVVGFVSAAGSYALWSDNAPRDSNKLSPQYRSVLSPLTQGAACWFAGHLWYPGRFVICYEEKNALLEAGRLCLKAMLAFHRIHLPYMLGWSFAFGMMCKPFRSGVRAPLPAPPEGADTGDS